MNYLEICHRMKKTPPCLSVCLSVCPTQLVKLFLIICCCFSHFALFCFVCIRVSGFFFFHFVVYLFLNKDEVVLQRGGRGWWWEKKKKKIETHLCERFFHYFINHVAFSIFSPKITSCACAHSSLR